MKATHDEKTVCRACRSPISAGKVSRCPHCGYINLSIIEHGLSFDWLTPEYSTVPVETMFREQLRQASDLVASDVRSATCLMLTKMIQLDQVLDRHRLLGSRAQRSLLPANQSRLITLVKSVQLLYLLISAHGGVQFEVASGQASFADGDTELWARIQDAASLAYLSMRITSGEETASVRGKTLILRLTELARLAAETWENEYVIEQNFPDHFLTHLEPDIDEMQRAVLGFSARDCLNLMHDNFAMLRELSRVQHIGPLLLAELDDAREPARTILQALTLNLRRAQQFEYPFFFDLAKVRSSQTSGQLPVEAAALGWTYYYPCYEVQTETGRRAALFSVHIWVTAMANMDATRSQMAFLLEKCAKSTTKGAMVLGSQKKVSARFEHRVGEYLRASGFVIRTQAELPVGEIDILGARVGKKKITEIVVIEAKDLDMPLHKPGSLANAKKTLQDGAKQLFKRSNWVAENWADILNLLGLE